MANNSSSIPDYYEQDYEYNEPEYSMEASPSINLKLYRDFRTLWAQRLFHEACDDYDPRRPEKTDVNIIEYLYHPGFAEAFAAWIGATHEDGNRLALADVEYNLEKKYGDVLQRLDCDYLADILEDARESAQFPKNIERALQWLMMRKEELPPWPHWNIKNGFVPVSNAEIDTHEVGAGLITAQNSDRGQQYNESSSNPFDDILSISFPFEALVQLLHNIHLIDPATGKASNEAKAGNLRAVIFALRDRRCIIARTSAASISSAFKEVFMAEVSDSYIGKDRSNSKSLLKSSWQIEMYNSCISNIDTIIKNKQPPV